MLGLVTNIKAREDDWAEVLRAPVFVGTMGQVLSLRDRGRQTDGEI